MVADARKFRGKNQPLYLVDNIDTGDNYERKYAIMGSTGNVYYVTIKTIPECTCPDHVNRKRKCKHIYFVLIKLMHVSKINEDKPQYNKYDLLDMFSTIPTIANNLCVDEETRKKYDKLSNVNDTDDNEAVYVEKREDDDMCPICFDDLENGDELDYCKYVCGKQIHLTCFNMWCKINAATCVYCRAKWTVCKVDKDSEYINLN